MSSYASCAANVPIFRILPPERIGELAKSMHHRRYGKGEVVIAAETSVEHLVVLARGRLNLIHASSGGREQLVRSLQPGEFVGEMALFTPTYQQGDLIAAEESDVCLVPRQAVQSVMQSHPEVPLRVVEVLARRLADAEQLIANLGLRDVGQRLASELLRSAAGCAPTPQGLRVTLPVTWAEMAVRLGTTPESLSRRLRGLADQGIIVQEAPRTVVIKDLGRLRSLVE